MTTHITLPQPEINRRQFLGGGAGLTLSLTLVSAAWRSMPTHKTPTRV